MTIITKPVRPPHWDRHLAGRPIVFPLTPERREVAIAAFDEFNVFVAMGEPHEDAVSVSTNDEIRDAWLAASLALRNEGSSGLPVPDGIGVAAILSRWGYRVIDDGPVREFTVRDAMSACKLRGLALANAE